MKRFTVEYTVTRTITGTQYVSADNKEDAEALMRDLRGLGEFKRINWTGRDAKESEKLQCLVSEGEKLPT